LSKLFILIIFTSFSLANFNPFFFIEQAQKDIQKIKDKTEIQPTQLTKTIKSKKIYNRKKYKLEY